MVCGLSECMCTVCLQQPAEVRRGMGSLKTVVAGSCEPLCQCWEPNLYPLQERQTLLTTDPSLQSPPLPINIRLLNLSIPALSPILPHLYTDILRFREVGDLPKTRQKNSLFLHRGFPVMRDGGGIDGSTFPRVSHSLNCYLKGGLRAVPSKVCGWVLRGSGAFLSWT